MKQKLFPKIIRFIFILIFLISFNLPTKAQVEIKLNPPVALYGIFQLGIELPVGPDFGFETEFVFYATEGNKGGGLLAHGKYYFTPDFGWDNFYVGLLAGGFGGQEQFAAFGFEAGYKWVGKRNILFEIGGSIGRATSLGVVPYGRLLIGYRFPKKKKK